MNRIKILNNWVAVLFIMLTYLFVTKYAYADYVLPYPSFMPGHAMYAVRQLVEKVQKHWYFGDMAKVKYHLKMADKYLVEAKILVEYEQIKLAMIALEKSDNHFTHAVLYERDVLYDKKDNGEQKQILKEAGEKHIEVIELLEEQLPDEIEWKEEKQEPVTLHLGFIFKQSSHIRNYANR